MDHPIPRLLAMEITRIVADLAQRQDVLVRVWGLHRHRWPLLEAAHSRWQTLRHEQLDQLSARQAVEVDGFYRALEQLVFYVQNTVDMPLHLDDTLTVRLQVLGEQATRALAALGQPIPDVRPQTDRDGASVIDGLFEENQTQARFGGRPLEE